MDHLIKVVQEEQIVKKEEETKQTDAAVAVD